MKKVLFICVTMLLICISGKATERNLLLIPYPQQVSIKQGNYNLTDNVKIGADPLFTQELKKLQEVLTEDFGLKSQIVKPSKADISLCYDASFMQEEKEAYQLEVTDMKITIRAQMATGIFYGIQSLRQLIKSEAGKWIIPKLTITDYPALSWRYDGKPHGGFYTQTQIRNIIKYASERHITIIPEIEMPGHSAAAIAAYPWLSATGKEIKVPCNFGVQYDVFNVTDPKVLNFLNDVIDEVTALFSSGILHIGGDEVRYDQWNASSSVQKFIQEKGFSSASDIQVWFTNQMSKVIAQKGWRMMGWNDITGEKLHHFQSGDKEGTERLAPGTIVQFWKGDSDMLQRAAEQGQHIVNSYNNFTYHIYPRIGAYAEVFWTLPIQKDYVRFRKSLEYFLTRWKKQGIIYGPTRNNQIHSTQQTNIEFGIPDEYNDPYRYITGTSDKALSIGN